MTIVVLGAPGSGLSLMTGILHALGVSLWETADSLNRSLLDDARAAWDRPPALDGLAATGRRWKHGMEACLQGATRPGLWGWVDSQTALTIPILHPYLEEPRYIILRRDRPDAVHSLARYHGDSERWDPLVQCYEQAIAEFAAMQGLQTLSLRYEDLTHPKAAPWALRNLAAFLGLPPSAIGGLDEARIDRALAQIVYKDRWGFGSIGIGVPYYKGCYEFFRWWSWVLAGGLEVGDHLLNTSNLRCEVPIPLAHNGLVQEFLKTDADTLVIVEDDHCGQQDTIRNMRFKPANQAFDIVCASYVNRRDPIDAVVGFNFSGEMNEYGEVDCILDPMNVWETGTQPHDGAALGLVFIRRWVIEAMRNGANPEEYFWFDWRGRNSQDIVFYWRARQVGAQTGVDRDNPVGHVGKQVFTMKKFYAAREAALAKQKQLEDTKNG